MEEKITILGTIKFFFFFLLTTLVGVNTLVLIYLVPYIGSEMIPDARRGEYVWYIVSSITSIYLLLLVILGVAYLSIYIIKSKKWKKQKKLK